MTIFSKKFTLLELIAVTIILSVVTAVSLSFFTDTLIMGVRIHAREVTMQKGQICVDRIRKEILSPYAQPVIQDSGNTIRLGGEHAAFITFVDESIKIDDVVLMDKVKLNNGLPFSQIVDGKLVVNFTADIDHTETDMDFSFVVTPRD